MADVGAHRSNLSIHCDMAVPMGTLFSVSPTRRKPLDGRDIFCLPSPSCQNTRHTVNTHYNL